MCLNHLCLNHLSLSHLCLNHLCLNHLCLNHLCLNHLCLNHLCLNHLCLNHLCLNHLCLNHLCWNRLFYSSGRSPVVVSTLFQSLSYAQANIWVPALPSHLFAQGAKITCVLVICVPVTFTHQLWLEWCGSPCTKIDCDSSIAFFILSTHPTSIPSTYLLHTFNIPSTYHQHTFYIQSTYHQHTFYIPSTYLLPSTYHQHTFYRPSTFYIPSIYLLHTLNASFFVKCVRMRAQPFTWLLIAIGREMLVIIV